MYDEEDTSSDADVTQICDFTGLSAAQALTLLKANKNDVGVAINEYMDKGADALPLPRLIPLSMVGVFPAKKERENKTEESEESQEQQPPGEQDGVRPPLQPQEDILVDTLEARALNRRSIKRPRRTGATAFDAFRNFAVETNRQEQMLAMSNGLGFVDPMYARNEAHVRRLEDLFRPPLDIIFQGTFASARSVCMVDGKWLMVNPQSPTEFSCQELNRDIWSDPTIKSIVEANFVFWQVYIDSEDGLAYHQYYPVEKFPYVSIIDPRTGELLKKWNVIDKAHFPEQLMDFLQKNDAEKILWKDENDAEKVGSEAQVSTSAVGIENIKLGKSVIFVDLENDEKDGPVATNPIETARSVVEISKIALKRAAASSELDAAIPLKRTDPRGSVMRSRGGTDGRVSRRQGRIVTSTVTSADQEEPDMSRFEQCSSYAESVGRKPAEDVAIEVDSSSEEGSEDDQGAAASGPLIRLCLHLPDKGKKIVSFPAAGKIQLLHKALARDGYPRRAFEYVLNFPKRKVCSKEAGQSSFASLGIAHNDTIFVYSK